MTPSFPDSIEVVVVPLDGSDFAERAVPVAVQLAARLGAQVHLLSAVATADDVDERETALARLSGGAQRMEHSVVVDLDPAGAIHKTLQRLGRAVACMASRGRGRSAGLMGSAASDVVARGHDPLVVVGPTIDERPHGKGVIVCVDGTPASATLITVGQHWAELLDEPLCVVTVAEPVLPPVRPGPVRRAFGPDGEVDGYLESLAAPFRAKGGEVQTLALYDPISPAEGIAGYVREHPAASVVVGSHARSGLARIVFRSESAGIVHRSPSPVLVVPRHDLS